MFWTGTDMKNHTGRKENRERKSCKLEVDSDWPDNSQTQPAEQKHNHCLRSTHTVLAVIWAITHQVDYKHVMSEISQCYVTSAANYNQTKAKQTHTAVEPLFQSPSFLTESSLIFLCRFPELIKVFGNFMIIIRTALNSFISISVRSKEIKGVDLSCKTLFRHRDCVADTNSTNRLVNSAHRKGDTIETSLLYSTTQQETHILHLVLKYYTLKRDMRECRALNFAVSTHKENRCENMRYMEASRSVSTT